MMSGTAELYYEGENYICIEKCYENGYIFRAYLPNEGVTVAELTESLTAEQLITPGIYDGKAILYMPKIHFESDAMNLIPSLYNLGMKSAFGAKAEFGRMMKTNPVYITKVVHKTFLDIDEEGTKAAAATAIEMKCYAAAPQPIDHTVTLDRPFLYAIIDETNGVPLFIGTYE